MTQPDEQHSDDSEFQKMIRGEMYNALDPYLVTKRRNAKIAQHDFAQQIAPYYPEDREAYVKSLSTLLPNAPIDTTWIEPSFKVDYGCNIYIGKNFYANMDCVILDVCPVTIGDYVLLGPGVHIYTATHPMDYMARRQEEYGKPVVIGNDVWIGGRAVINPGVTIGSRVVIASGAVVTTDIPDDCFVAGVPAVIKKRFTSLQPQDEYQQTIIEQGQ